MTTVLTPPPVPPQPAAEGPPPQPPTPPRRTSSTVISVIAIVAGCLLLLGALGSAVFAAVRAGAVSTETFTVAADGVTGIDIDVSAVDLTIVYGDTDDAQLQVEGTPGDWTLERDEDELTVRTERGWWGLRFGFDGGDRAVLTLPASLEQRAIDASLALAAGSITADGRYDELDVDLGAGAIDVTGSAAELDVDVSAGRAVLALDDVRSAEVRVSAGSVEGELTGTAPRTFTADVSAGRVNLTLPDETYRVTSDVSAGNFDNMLDTSTTASARVDVTVSAGEVVLRPAR